MNTIVTSQEEILSACRDIIAKNGLPALNMRAVAKECGVSVGAVYYYFPSKSDLVAAAIQDMWQWIFRMEETDRSQIGFSAYAEWIFRRVRYGMERYPNFLTAHSMSFADTDRGKARSVMEQYFRQMKKGLLDALNADNSVRDHAFGPGFTREQFVDFVFSNLLSCLVGQEESCQVLLEVIKRAIY